MLSEALIKKFGFANGLEIKKDENNEDVIVSYPKEWGKVPTKKQLDQIKKDFSFSESIKSIRNKKIYSGITVNGFAIDTDEVTQTRMIALQIKATADNNFTVKWKTENGFIDLTAAQIIALSDAILIHVQNCFIAESKIDFEKIKSLEELEEAFLTEYAAL